MAMGKQEKLNEKCLALHTSEAVRCRLGYMAYVCMLLILSLSPLAWSASFDQTDWSGGATVNTAVDPIDQTGWDEYSSKDAEIGAGPSLTISSSAGSLTHTSNSDFALAPNVKSHTTYSDFSNGALLTNAKVNNGAVGILPATLTMVWTARPGWDYSPGFTSPNAAFADLDGDGDLDMMVGDNDGDIEGYRNTGSDDVPAWTLVSGWKITRASLGFPNMAVPTLGDIDGDGDHDLFVGFGSSGITAFENIGNAAQPVWNENSDWALSGGVSAVKSPALADLNGDGVLDMLVGGNYSAGPVNAYSFNIALLPASPWVRQTTWDPPDGFGGGPRASIGDLDGDGDPDLVVGWRNRGNLQLVSNANSGLPSAPTTWTDNGFSGPAFANGDVYDYPALVDLDSDGDLDLLVGASGTTALLGYENASTTYNTSGTYTSAVIDTGAGNAGYTTLAYTPLIPASTTLTVDVRAGNTATPDAFWTAWQMGVTNGGDISALGNRRYVQYRVNLSTADTSVTPLMKGITINYSAYPAVSSTTVVNNGVSLDLLSRTVAWEGTNSWSLTVSGANAPDGNVSNLVPTVGDLNGDGFADLLLGDDWSNSALGVYLNDGSNNWVYTSGWNLPFGPSTVSYPVLGDLDGDGDQDVLAGAGNSSTIVAFENTGGVSGPPGWSANAGWNLAHTVNGANAALADLDNDGDLDAMVGHVGNPQNVIQGYENQSAGSGPVWVRNSAWDVTITSIWVKRPALSDLDGDGDYDLLIGNNSGNRQVFENVGAVTSPAWAQNSGWLPPALTQSFYALSDLDSDGDQDLLVGQSGLINGRRNIGVSSYSSPGDYYSSVVDFGFAAYTTLDYTANIRTGTVLSVDVRGGSTSLPGVGWSAWQTGVASGGDISALSGNRYLQYRVNMAADGGNTLSPELEDVTVNFTSIASPRSLVSSPFNTAVSGNFMNALSWTEALPASTDLQVQLRTSPDNAAWTSWMGPDGTSGSYWNSANTHGGGCSGSGAITCATIPTVLKDGADDQWFQYRVTLVTTGGSSPTFSDVSVAYVSTLPPGVTLNKTTGLTTTEGLTTDTFTVVLDALPAGEVTVTLSSDQPGEATPSPAALTFNTTNWSTPQTVTVAGVNDFIDDGAQGFTISADPGSVADAGYDALATLTVTGSNADDDTASITVNPTSGLTTNEAGTTSTTFTVVLNSEPTANVVLALSSSDTTEGTISPGSLTFNSSNWNVAQTVTVTAVDEGIDDGDIAYNIETAVASSGDLLYNGMNPSDVSITNIDDDIVDIIVTAAAELITTEAGGTATFSVVLGSEPTANVTIGITSSNASEGRLDKGQLIFTSANWNVSQSVTVTGQDEGLTDGDIAYTVILASPVSADPAYNGYALSNIAARNLDDDLPGILVSPSSGLVTTEAGGTASFTARLGSIPGAMVTVNFTSDDATEGSVSPVSFTFHAGNWDIAQTITVTGIDDAIDDGDVAYTVTAATAVGADAVYNAVVPVSISLTNTDDDGAGATDSGFSQTDWRSGSPGNASTCAAANGIWSGTECTATDLTNQAGWQAYYSKAAGVAVINSGTDLQSAVRAQSLTHTSNADFGIAVSSQTHTTYDDFSTTGSLLSTTKINNGAVSLQPATLVKSWVARPAWDFATGMGWDNATFADLDGDGDLDMLVGQTNGNVEGYRNIGSDDSHSWESYPGWRIDRFIDGTFANNAIPALGDIDGDGDNDLLIGYGGAPVRAFENTGNKNITAWTRNTAWDLTPSGISNVFRPVLVDLNGDGQTDLLVGGNYSAGPIQVYQFDGSTPWLRDAATISWDPPDGLQGYPRTTAGDLDGDDDIDLLVGWRDTASLKGITNTNSGIPSTPAWAQDFDGPAIASSYDHPTLVDLDSDGDLDLMVGTNDGLTLYGYENSATVYNSAGTYTSAVIDTGGQDGYTTLDFSSLIPANTTLTMDVGAGNTSIPDGSWVWLNGVANGGSLAPLGTARYVQYRANLSTTNSSVTPLLKDVTIHYTAYPYSEGVVATGDRLLLQQLSQSVAWDSTDTWSYAISAANAPADGNYSFQAPALGDLDGDGHLDLLLGDGWSNTALGVHQNTGAIGWAYQSSWNVPFTFGATQTFTSLADVDGDGDQDAFIGGIGGRAYVTAYENRGGPMGPPLWYTKVGWNINHSLGGSNPHAAFADLDGDGDLDALVGVTGGTQLLYAYENQAATPGAVVWVYKSEWNASINGSFWTSMPTLGDIDSDGDYDLIVGDRSGTDTETYENIGSAASPVWNLKAAWLAPDVGGGSSFPALADLDNDGVVDLLIGDGGNTLHGRRNVGVKNYPATGRYTSSVLDFGMHLGFTTMSYNVTLLTGTTLSVEVRTGTTAVPDGSWSSWQIFSSGADISVLGTPRYLQYRVNFSANGGNTASPVFDEITFNYSGVDLESSLISSAYNTTSATNLITALSWVETLAANSGVRVQLRTAPDSGGVPGSWSAWAGPDGSAASYWSSPNTYAGGCSGSGTITCTVIPSMLRNGENNQWLQYRVTLVSDGIAQPLLSDITVLYTSGTAGGIIVNPVAGLTTTEVGGTATFTVELTSAPAADVVINLDSGDLTEGTVSPASLTFTNGSWGQQTVTVSGVDDAVNDGDIAYTVFTSASVSSDATFNNRIAGDVSVTNTNDDTSIGGVIVSPTAGLVTTEAGGLATFTVRLATVPSDTVLINVTSSDGSEGTVLPNILTFNAGNWSAPQTVTVTGEDDNSFDQNVAYTVLTSAGSSDPNYAGLAVADVLVTNNDDEVADVVLTPGGGWSVNEPSGVALFGITLASRPVANVTFSLSTSDITEGSLLPFIPLTFTPTNWNVPQNVTLFAQNDLLIDGTVNYSIVTSTFISSDINFSGVNPSDFAVTTTDDDGYGFMVTPTTGLFTTEDSGTAWFTIRARSKPSDDVFINLSSSSPGEGYVPDQVIITPEIALYGVSVKVTGVKDTVVDGDQPYTINIANAVSSDLNYNGLPLPSVAVTNRNTNTSFVEFDQGGAGTGRAVTFAGDVNGDGYDDVLVGVPFYDGVFSDQGRARLYYGTATSLLSDYWSINYEGDQLNAYFGYSVAAAGDVNNDGFDDVIVGAYAHDAGGALDSDRGRVYLYLGASDGLSTTPAATLDGQIDGGYFGYSVAGAGDVNNDGYADVVVGAYGSDTAYVYLGTSGGSGVAITPVQTLVAAQIGSHFGVSVAGAGDVNGDGFSDVIVGAEWYSNGEANEGSAAIYYGTNTASGSITPTSSWLVESDQAGAFMGSSVANIGDVNGNGVNDVAVGAYGYDNGQIDEGRVFVFYGTTPGGLPVSADLTMELNQPNAYFGRAVSGGGDINRDGFADVIIGADGFDNDQIDEGRTNIYFGSESGVNTVPGLSYEGDQSNSQYGIAVGGGGDFNNDSYADVVVGADLFDGVQVDEGRAYLQLTPPLSAVGVTATPITAMQTTEGGDGASFSVVLDSLPADDVFVELFSGDSSEGAINSNPLLVFTPADWYLPQTVSVNGLDDLLDDGDVVYKIYATVISSDAAYDNITVNEISLINVNDDYTVFVSATDTNVGESGPDTGTFTFTRTGETTSNLTVLYSVTGSATNGVDYGSLFGSLTIPAGQSGATVSVTPIDDAIADVGEKVTLTLVPSGNYLIGGAGSSTVTIVDNDVAGITVAAADGLMTSETGGAVTFTVVLNTAPSDTVTIGLSSSDGGEGKVEPAALDFTTGNWNVPQLVTVIGQDDVVVDNNVPYSIVTAPAVSLDGIYSGIDAIDVAVTNIDDESLSNIFVTATQSGVGEAGPGNASFTLVRVGSAVADMTVHYQISGTASTGVDYLALGSSIVIPASVGNRSVTLNLFPQNDVLSEGDEQVVLTLLPDPAYVIDKPTAATVTIFDDESPSEPTVNFTVDQVVADGATVTITAVLNKQALTYPVTIPYVVSTNSATNPVDHDAADGVITITSAATTGTATFNVVNDGAGDSGETVTFTMGAPDAAAPTNAVVGGRRTHTVTISESNIAPTVSMTATQLGANTQLAVGGNGNVTVTATTLDANIADTHSFDWSLTNNNLVDINDGDPATLLFDPSVLLDGFYKVRLTVTDDGVPAGVTSVDMLFEVVSTAPTITAAVDTDGDGVVDTDESYIDTDRDGVPDYLDSNTLASNELQQRVDSPTSYIMRTEAGLALRLGDIAFAAGSDGAEVTEADIASYGDGEGQPGTNPQDSVQNTGGYFDFEIAGLAVAGQSVRIVIPQQAAIPAGAVYRKYNGSLWYDFVEDGSNAVASAPGLPGECPLPGDGAYQPGLGIGHYCIQLTIQDGGPNDADGSTNYVIEDPGQIGKRPLAVDAPPAASNGAAGGGGGGGALSALPLMQMLLLGWWCIASRRCSKGAFRAVMTP